MQHPTPVNAKTAARIRCEFTSFFCNSHTQSKTVNKDFKFQTISSLSHLFTRHNFSSRWRVLRTKIGRSFAVICSGFQSVFCSQCLGGLFPEHGITLLSCSPATVSTHTALSAKSDSACSKITNLLFEDLIWTKDHSSIEPIRSG